MRSLLFKESWHECLEQIRPELKRDNDLLLPLNALHYCTCPKYIDLGYDTIFVTVYMWAD